ncbi:alpha-2A adrenergic receptor [Octopus sinensis]|uniref:Alpha-2A adrenergic receptor n=1 Tax=Octopus sinensis TaxID=2607531 RepID=A0A6P7T4H4_9MOLL|nr:alpha-2A adrenergic receptor [Octopus sinensis]
MAFFRFPFDFNFTEDNGLGNTTAYPSGFDPYTEQVTFDFWRFSLENETFNDSAQNSKLPVFPGAGFPSGYSWPTIIISTCFVVVLVVLVGLGNLLVCIAIYTDKNLKITQNSFIASLAIADMLLGILVMPLSWSNEILGYWFFGPVLCDLWLSVDVLLCTASILNLVLISLDRYWSITRALHYPQQRTPKRAAIMIAIVWVLSGIICLPPLIGWKQPRPEVETLYPMCFLSEDLGYVLYSSCGSFYIPMVIMVIVYFRIYLAALRRARGTFKKNPKEVCPETPKEKTTSSTATSFTTPPKNNNQKSITTNASSHAAPNSLKETKSANANGNTNCIEVKPVDKETPIPNETTVPVKADNKILTVPGQENGHSASLQIEDEQRNLINTDSDSVSILNNKTATSDSEVGEIRPPNQRLVLVTDTESSMESPKKTCVKGDVSTELETVEENAKPLLAGDTDSTTYYDSPYLSPETQMTDTGTCTEMKTPNVTRKETNQLQPANQVHHSENELHGENHEQEQDLPSTNANSEGLPSPNVKEINDKSHKDKKKNRKKKEHILMTNFKKGHKNKGDIDKNRKEQTWKAPSARDAEKQKRRVAKARERRATIVLGIVMAAFILCWCPFFTLYVISAFCDGCIPMLVFDIFFWFGYCNSALNPVIYTVFNRDFKHAFIKILFGNKNFKRR